MANQLEKRWWSNCGLCPVCKRTMGLVAHLLVHYDHTIRVSGLIKDLFGILHSLSPNLTNAIPQEFVSSHEWFQGVTACVGFMPGGWCQLPKAKLVLVRVASPRSGTLMV
jgi:hypothetical protein